MIYTCIVISMFVLYSTIGSSTVNSQTNPYDLTDIQISSHSLSGILVYNSTRSGDPSKSTLQTLDLTLSLNTGPAFRLRILDHFNRRFEVPPEVIQDLEVSSPMYNFTYSLSPFGLNIFRISDNVSLFHISPYQNFQYNDEDIIFTHSFSESRNIYGLGERVQPSFKLSSGIYTIFNKDQSSPIDDGTTGGMNMYGSHPFYLSTDANHTAIGGFLLNINAMDVTTSSDAITFRTIGGVIDFFGLSGPSSTEVISQYHKLIGYPALPPYWVMGWHQCRFGYTSLNKWIEVVNHYTAHNLPLDGFWTDIDYMDQFRDWTIDEQNYPIEKVQQFIEELHGIDKKFVAILDAAVAITAEGEYEAFDEGIKQNVFVMSPYDRSKVELCKVWPGYAAFIDWLHPNATQFWIQQTLKFHKILDFDGIWLDMNEPTNFCSGQCDHEPTIINNLTLPYTPGNIDLNTLSMDMASPHYGSNLSLEFNLHNTYPYYQSQATSSFFSSYLHKRPFILSRSSMPGSNRYSIHWSGDNWSNFEYLSYSIGGIFNYGMFGFPLMGADICGFNNNTSEELCSRWMQLGTLYPFARNHNMKGQRDQEPWTFNSTLLATSEMSIRLRYRLLHYIYSNIFMTSLEGGMVFKPTFFEFPEDDELYNVHIDDNFMLGNAVIVHPVMTEGDRKVGGYIPRGIWYEMNGKKIVSQKGKIIEMKAELPGVIPVHVRGGYIIGTLDEWKTALNVEQLRRGNISLVVAVDNGSADGFLIFDDLESPDTIQDKKYSRINYSFRTDEFETVSTLSIVAQFHGYTLNPSEFSSISHLHIFGCLNSISEIFLQIDSTLKPLKALSNYDSETQICDITFSEKLQPDLQSKLILKYIPGIISE